MDNLIFYFRLADALDISMDRLMKHDAAFRRNGFNSTYVGQVLQADGLGCWYAIRRIVQQIKAEL